MNIFNIFKRIRQAIKEDAEREALREQEWLEKLYDKVSDENTILAHYNIKEGEKYKYFGKTIIIHDISKASVTPCTVYEGRYDYNYATVSIISRNNHTDNVETEKIGIKLLKYLKKIDS